MPELQVIRGRTVCLPWAHPACLPSSSASQNTHKHTHTYTSWLRWVPMLLVQISAQIHAMYQFHCTLRSFHLLSPDPLSSFHHSSNKLSLKAFQHPPGLYAMTHHNDTSTCYESGRCAPFHQHKTFTWDTLRQTQSTWSLSHTPTSHACALISQWWRCRLTPS